MIEELSKTLEVIEFLNKSVKKNISKEELDEEKANLNDFIELQQNLKKI